MKKRFKLLIDTDIGDEIDDALALYLAMDMDCELVGVTTVFRNAVERARLTKRLLSEYGKGYERVPVYAGYCDPLGMEVRKWGHTCHYSSEIDGEEYRPDGNTPEDAVDFIIDCCKKYGEDLIVVAIGPFTNIARVIQKDAEALSKVKNVVIMGGAFYKQYADWNVMCDTLATDLMFRSLGNLVCLGADVTHTLDVGEKNYATLLECGNRGGALSYLCGLIRLWREENPSRCPTLHDPLAVYYVLDRSICKTEDITVKVITDGYARGLTLNVESYSKAYMNSAYEGDPLPRVTVAKTVESRKFIDLFMEHFT